MNSFQKSIFDLRELEQYNKKNHVVNRMHPASKIFITLVYILLLSSVDKYNISLMLLMGVFPIFIVTLIDIPIRVIGSKLFLPLIFSVSLGIFNPIFDRETIMTIGNIEISGGVLSFFVLVLKGIFLITTTLCLVATTTMEEIAKGLEFYKVPKSITMVLVLMYRYITVLLSQVSQTIDAYQLRASYKKGIHISTWGSLIGQIAIRSFKQSEEIYNAMLLRGYGSEERQDDDNISRN